MNYHLRVLTYTVRVYCIMWVLHILFGDESDASLWLRGLVYVPLAMCGGLIWERIDHIENE